MTGGEIASIMDYVDCKAGVAPAYTFIVMALLIVVLVRRHLGREALFVI